MLQNVQAAVSGAPQLTGPGAAWETENTGRLHVLVDWARPTQFTFAHHQGLWAKSVQSYLTLCNPMDDNPQGSSVHGDSPGKNTGLCCHALLQGIFPTQGLNPGLLHQQARSLPLAPLAYLSTS